MYWFLDFCGRDRSCSTVEDAQLLAALHREYSAAFEAAEEAEIASGKLAAADLSEVCLLWWKSSQQLALYAPRLSPNIGGRGVKPLCTLDAREAVGSEDWTFSFLQLLGPSIVAVGAHCRRAYSGVVTVSLGAILCFLLCADAVARERAGL